MYQSKFWPVFGQELAGRPAVEGKGNQVVYSSFASAISYPPLFLSTKRCIGSSALALLAASVVSVLSGCGGVTFNATASNTHTTAATLSMISCGVQSLTGAQTKTCSVYLSASATDSTPVALTSSNAALSLPASVVVAAGAKTVEFNAVTEAVSKSVSVTITGKADGVTQTDVITLDPVATPDLPPVAALSNLSCETQSVIGPKTITCTVNLGAAATSQTEVMLSTSSNALKTPKSVSIAAGKTAASFSLIASAVSSTQKTTLSATADAVTKSQTIMLYPAGTSIPATLSKVSCNTQTLTGPANGSCAVYLSAAATRQTAVTLSSSSSALRAPASVNVAVGKTTAAFSVTASAVSTPQKATLTATAGGVKQTDVITLSPAATNPKPVAKLNGLSCGTQSLTGAQTKACSVSLTAASTSQLVVTLSSSSSALRPPASVTIATGGTSASFSVTATAVTATKKATLTATADGVSQTDVMTLYPLPAGAATLSNVSCGTQTLTGPTTHACAVYLSAAATSPTIVKLSSSSAALQVPASLTVPTGSASAGFSVTASSVTSSVNVTLAATSGGVTQTDVIQLEGSSSSAPPPGGHKVRLSWNPPAASSVPVEGYNVYRSTAGASAYQLLNSSVDAATSYTDSDVQGGESYDYIVKSVDSSGIESPPSNITNVTIP
jgi:hypothetical protein